MGDNTPNVPEIRMSGENGGKTFAVVLPCSTEEFGDFISGLLGEPQTITSKVDGPYVVDRDAIRNIFSLIQQRVFQQNDSSLVQWTITIIYDDSQSVKLDSMDEFKSYAEIKSHISVGFNMHFTYLVKFQGQKFPAKQEIDVSFSAGGRRIYVIEHALMGIEAGFVVRIQHTARSWGVDIESLIIGHLSTLRKVEYSVLRRYTSKHHARIAPVIALLLFLASMIGVLYRIDKTGSALATKTLVYLNEFSAQERVSKAMDIVISQLADGVMQKNFLISVIFIVIFGIGSIAISVFMESKMEFQESGALLLTNEAIRKFDSKNKLDRIFWSSVALPLLLGVATGVAGNFVYGWLMK